MEIMGVKRITDQEEAVMSNAGSILWNLVQRIAHAILAGVFRLLGKDLTDAAFEAFMQFVKFGLVGVSNTIVNYAVYAGCLIVFQRMNILLKTDYLVAQVIAFLLSVLWSFYWNNKLVFVVEEGKQRSVWKALLKTYVSYSFTGLFLNSVLLILWVRLFHISEFLGPVINLVINVPINFFINKFWAFKTNTEE